MILTIVECFVGFFAFDDQDEVVDAVFFPKQVEYIVGSIERLQRGESVDEALTLVQRLVDKGYKEFNVENENLAKIVTPKFNVEITVEQTSSAGECLRGNLAQLAVERGFVASTDEFYALAHTVTSALAKSRVTEASGNRALLVSQTIMALDDSDRSFNLFANRLREWYGYHFPELGRLVDKSDLYVQLVASIGERRNFTPENLAATTLVTDKARAVSEAAKASMGAEFDEGDIEEVRGFAESVLGLQASRERIERYLDELMGQAAPNIREVAGSTLGARLIAAAGGLESMSKKSSSTIQVLGAEKALFRSLKTGARPPKHGLIFQHKDIHQSPRWQRGKIARALAGKLAIAARLDFYGGEYRGDELKRELDERVREIKEKYAEPPKKGKR